MNSPSLRFKVLRGCASLLLVLAASTARASSSPHVILESEDQVAAILAHAGSPAPICGAIEISQSRRGWSGKFDLKKILHRSAANEVRLFFEKEDGYAVNSLVVICHPSATIADFERSSALVLQDAAPPGSNAFLRDLRPDGVEISEE